MRKAIKKAAALLLALVLSMGSAACAKEQAPALSEEAAEVLVYGSGDYTAINPALYEHGEINLLLFAGLMAHNGQNEVVPDVAETWEYDAKNCTYTFKLRRDVYFHDGHPLTSRDVRFTLQAIMDPENASENASNYEDILEIETPDDYTVILFLAAPNVALLDYLAIGILPAHLLEGKDLALDSFNQNPVGAGPYRLEQWDMGQSITLRKHEQYHRGEPKIDEIIFKIVEDTQARALQLQSGELDLAQVTPEDAQMFRQGQNSQDYRVYQMDTADYRGILYNFNGDFFSRHRELPNILSYAIDRQAIVDTVLMGCGEAAYSPLQKGPYVNEQMEKFEYNPQKAMQLLEQAGWSKGEDGIYQKEGERLQFCIHNSQGDQVRIDMSNICAQQLGEIGADVCVKVDAQVDWAGQDAYLIGWGSPFDPDDHTYKVFGTQKGANYSGYSNEQVDFLLLSARQTEDREQRKQLYAQFQQALSEDMPYTFLAYVDAIYVSTPRLKGIAEDTVLGHHGVGIFWNVAEWELEQ